MEAIERFLSKGSDYGYGDGYGYGSGEGSGYGYGSGEGSGYGYGNGDGSDYGYGDGDGYGYGYGEGSGYGYSYGYGDGSDYGYGDGDGDGYGSDSDYGYGSDSGDGVVQYNFHKVYLIDGTQTIIESVHGQYARGYILQSDLTLVPCYIARIGDFFAHGKTLADAKRDAEVKALENEPLESRIERFCATYNDVDAMVANTELYKWHNTLTGSCEFGRKQFAKDHGIDIDNGNMSVREFIELTKGAFGGEIIKRLKDAYGLK